MSARRLLRWVATRALRTTALLLAVLLSSHVLGARITIDAASDPDSRLDIRTIVLPGGEEVQLYVVEGDGLVISIDEDVLKADHVEFDLTNRLVRVVGFGSFTKGGETVEGYGLIIDLSAESFLADDVLIVTEAIDVKGDSASRVPGLIRVALGEFSLCSRCSQQVEDYGFQAARLELYPGDRLVAFDVTVLIRAIAVLQLPLMVLPLAQPDRQPRLEYRTGTASERALIAVTWPYVAGPDAYQKNIDLNSQFGGTSPMDNRDIRASMGPSDFDQTHVLSSVLVWTPLKGFELGGRFRLSSGYPRTRVVGSYYDARRDRAQPIFAEHNGTRIPLFVQFDVRVAQTIAIAETELQIYLEVQNVTNRINVEELVYSPDFARRGAIESLPILPVLGLSWTF